MDEESPHTLGVRNGFWGKFTPCPMPWGEMDAQGEDIRPGPQTPGSTTFIAPCHGYICPRQRCPRCRTALSQSKVMPGAPQNSEIAITILPSIIVGLK